MSKDKLEGIIAASKINEFLHKKEEDKKEKEDKDREKGTNNGQPEGT